MDPCHAPSSPRTLELSTDRRRSRLDQVPVFAGFRRHVLETGVAPEHGAYNAPTMTHDLGRRAGGAEVPIALRRWFVAHGVIDWFFAVPLFFFPEPFLGALGWAVVDPMATRGVAAALVGIGTQSLLSRRAGAAVYRHMLSLKILWSSTAVLGFAWSALAGGPRAGWAFAAIFAGFDGLWTYWRWRLRTADVAANDP